ncbi:MAG: DUF4156 domain-containing protein [Luteimonas sp.]
MVPPTMHKLLLPICLTFALGACTWVHMAPGASAVRIASSAPTGCEKLGEVEVSVKDNIAFVDRNPLRVRDELETLARNEGPALGADTMHPMTEPLNGAQTFAAWRCGSGGG